MKTRRLGKGLNALIPTPDSEEIEPGSSEQLIEYRKLLEYGRLAPLLKNIDAVSPKSVKKEEPTSDVIEL